MLLISSNKFRWNNSTKSKNINNTIKEEETENCPHNPLKDNVWQIFER